MTRPKYLRVVLPHDAQQLRFPAEGYLVCRSLPRARRRCLWEVCGFAETKSAAELLLVDLPLEDGRATFDLSNGLLQIYDDAGALRQCLKIEKKLLGE